jgi:hypothetical protein
LKKSNHSASSATIGTETNSSIDVEANMDDDNLNKGSENDPFQEEFEEEFIEE